MRGGGGGHYTNVFFFSPESGCSLKRAMFMLLKYAYFLFIVKTIPWPSKSLHVNNHSSNVYGLGNPSLSLSGQLPLVS